MRSTIRSMWFVGLAAVLLVAWAGPAAAHGDDADVQLETIQPVAPLELEIGVFVTFANDADPAAPATIDVTATGPDGAVVGPVPMTAGADVGLYTSRFQVPVPGDWTINVETTVPVGAAEGMVTVLDPESTEDTSGTTVAPFDPDAAAGLPTTAPPAPVVAARSGNDAPTALIAGVAVFGVLSAVGVFLLLRSRRRSSAG